MLGIARLGSAAKMSAGRLSEKPNFAIDVGDGRAGSAAT